MARNKYVTTQVEEETFRGIIDAANLWGDSISMAAFKLIQRGLMSLDTELGSKTPLHIKVNRISQTLSNKMSTKQKITESYRLAKELNDDGVVKEIEGIAAELEIKL
jgi:hypothetical protein